MRISLSERCPKALGARGAVLASGWAGSLTMGAGQYCANPGLAIVIAGPDADEFIASANDALAQVGQQAMLTEGIANAYRAGSAQISESTDE